MIAALYVQPDGVYSTLPDVDLWPEGRDARRYDGPWPVVEHPPCGPWGFAARRWRRMALGEDQGCFAAGLRNLVTYGGVLEHPAGSSAWRHFHLPRPGGWGWTPASSRPVTAPGQLVTVPGGRMWSCAVDQGSYGHPAPKRTWLLLVTRTWVEQEPPPLVWGPSGAPGRVLDMPDATDREATPRPFAELLIALATGTYAPTRDFLETEAAAIRCIVCGKAIEEQARKGPTRVLCDEACRQRASRQRRAGGSIPRVRA